MRELKQEVSTERGRCKRKRAEAFGEEEEKMSSGKKRMKMMSETAEEYAQTVNEYSTGMLLLKLKFSEINKNMEKC